jgi:MIP family channel proteins
LLIACAGEVLGTYILVAIGTGIVAVSVMTDVNIGLWQVAVVWGLGVTAAIYASGALSGAHLNPAVTFALAVFRSSDFPRARALGYWAAQMAGAILGGLTTLWVFGSRISRFEAANALERGEAGSELSAMVFGEYFPNPAMHGARDMVSDPLSPFGAVAIEAFGVAILVAVIFALTDHRNQTRLVKYVTPLAIGATIAVLIGVLAPYTQAGLNPARDFGPRLVALFAGWGNIAIPGPANGFWVYIMGPLLGGIVGAGTYQLLVRRLIRRTSATQRDRRLPEERIS